ncbi:MAG: hypothetical protein A3H91_08430 [Gammaproteobacteria bacterium RIFCSPLOWO2_02_FULL_61_13]|nr:MAG: hypothetical protein A3H91_08430 [Gammaproteobacteria bacterium RIFCSPLOWO2_02_FULL_61_13]
MAKQKFDEIDRRKVIAELEKEFKVHLQSIGNRRIYLTDDNARRYCVLGGYEDWHGIPRDIMEREENDPSDTILVIAKRRRTSIDIFCGPFSPLIRNKKKLTRTNTGQFEFNLQSRGAALFVKEVPDLVLSKLGMTEYSQAGREHDVAKAEALAALQRLSPEERRQVLNSLANDSET